MIYTNLDNFFVSSEDLKNSPSRSDGISEETEVELRIFGATLIQEGGTLLDLPQVVMATGQVLFHRFYCKKSMAKYDVESVAMTCCWLATKLEEEPRRTRDVLAVFHRLQRRRLGQPLTVLDFYSAKYTAMKDGIVKMERVMLREFGFIVHVDHPHKLVLNHVNLLHKDVRETALKTRLMQEAFSLTNDSLRTTLCVRFKSETVACGLIFMAARRLEMALPDSPPWWQLFGVRYEDICGVCCEMQALYARPKAQFINVLQDAQASAMSRQPTPQASPLTANGQPSAVSGPAEPSSVPRPQGDSAARSDGRADEEQEPLANGGLHGSDRGPVEREEQQRPSKADRHDRKHKKDRERERQRDYSDKDRDRDRDRVRDRKRERDRERERERERERDRERSGHDVRMRDRAERHRPTQGEWRDRRDPERRQDRDRDYEEERAKQARAERSSSAAAANGRASRSPHKQSKRPIDWAAYKRGRDADIELPDRRRESPIDERAPARFPAVRPEAKRSREEGTPPSSSSEGEER